MYSSNLGEDCEWTEQSATRQRNKVFCSLFSKGKEFRNEL